MTSHETPPRLIATDLDGILVRDDHLLEAIAPGVSKAAALAEQRDISAAEVAAFGDMPNDLPMLAWAGRSYAVANAHPSVLAAVDEVIGSNDEGAVAQVLDRYFPAGPVTSRSKEDSVHG